MKNVSRKGGKMEALWTGYYSAIMASKVFWIRLQTETKCQNVTKH